MIPIINDHRKPTLTNTEKAISMLMSEIGILKAWNQGLQRQIAGLCIQANISPRLFSSKTRKQLEINNFLAEAQKVEEELIKAEHGDTETKEAGKGDSAESATR